MGDSRRDFVGRWRNGDYFVLYHCTLLNTVAAALHEFHSFTE